MSSLNIISRLVAYDRLSYENFLNGLGRLGWREASKERGIGHGSFKNTMVHILNVHEWLLVGGAQGRKELWRNPTRKKSEVNSLSELRSYRSIVWNEIDQLMTDLSETKLRSPASVPWLQGKYTLQDLFFQASFEQAHHLGEIIGAYWQINRAPPQMMWVPTLLKKRGSTR